MKKLATICSAVLLVLSLTVLCGTTTSCKSSQDTMYEANRAKKKAVNNNYRVRGTTQRNKATYRSY
ncbi:MAG: hypothetical protein IJU81_01065 [Bacteroidales bacterium]|nr:hypothetical protein [Bacteroidales bacterium]